MICVSIGNVTAGECLKRLQGLDLAEVRLDTMDVDAASVKRIFSMPLRIVATCRPGRYNQAQRFEIISDAAAAGAAYIDVETDAAPDFRQAVMELALRHGTQVIASYHNYVDTPGNGFLKGIIRDTFSSGAHLAKIACMVNSPVDAIRLLDLLKAKNHPGRLIVIGMGEKGRITRVASLFLGSPFTYASCESDEPLAPGQMSAGRLMKTMELIGHG